MSTIIKAGVPSGESHGAKAVAFNFADMTDRANDYLGTIRREAAQLIAQARQEADQIRQQAEQQGRAAATQQAQQTVQNEVAQRLGTVIPALKQAAGQLEDARNACLVKWEQSLIHLATAIAQRVIRHELTKQPEITLGLIKETLELATGAGRVKLYLSQQDRQALGEQSEMIAATLGRLGNTEIIVDPHLTPGGCRIETENGTIDQAIETQLARIEQELC